MKLDVSVLHYMSKEEWRVLAAIEMGMKNHEQARPHCRRSSTPATAARRLPPSHPSRWVAAVAARLPRRRPRLPWH